MANRAIRHVSLDVWRTLIMPNPEFYKALLRFLTAELSMPLADVEAAYREIKDGADRDAEMFGKGKTSIEVYDAFMIRLGRPQANWFELRRGIERLFAKYPPLVREDVKSALRAIQARGLGLSIASNTNFIRGEAMHDIVLGTWGVAWDFQTYSDQVGRAKPHPRFWKVVTERAWAHSGAKPHEILHVGDHKVCDGGCVSAHIQFALVDTPADVVPLLESICDQAQAA